MVPLLDEHEKVWPHLFFFTASLIKLQIFRTTLYVRYERPVHFAFLSHIFQCLSTIYIALIVDLSCSIV